VPDADLPGLTIHLFDTPGSVTLAANGEDEMVVRDLLLCGGLDAVAVIADAKNLRRSLALALEIAELGLPMVFNVNMLDEAESTGLDVDEDELARALGIPTNRTIAIEGVGVRRLAELILDAQVSARRVRFPTAIEHALLRLSEVLDNPGVEPRALALMFLMEDEGARAWVNRNLGTEIAERALAIVEQACRSLATPVRALILDCYHTEADRIAQRAVIKQRRSADLLARFGSLAQQPLSGTLIALGVLVLAYLWIGELTATRVVDGINTHLFQGLLVPLLDDLVSVVPSAFVRDAIMDPDFGLLQAGLFLAVGLVLPVLFAFYLLQAVLEDSGYLPRLAVLFDKLLRWLGLNGRGLIPLVLSFSCVTMAVITTRSLPTRKERLILTLLVIGLPCAPLLAVLVVILGKMPWTASAVVVAVLALRLMAVGLVGNRLIPGAHPDLILEIPRMRVPRARVLLVKTWRRTWQFMREAVPIFLIAAFAVFLFDRVGGLDIVEDLTRPLVQGVLGLPDQAVQVFIKTAIRREAGAAELSLQQGLFDNVQMVVTILVMTFVIPCINSLIVITKERGVATAAAILAFTTTLALATGAVVSFACHSLGITFA
jgi:ferrous iron transport protein B